MKDKIESWKDYCEYMDNGIPQAGVKNHLFNDEKHVKYFIRGCKIASELIDEKDTDFLMFAKELVNYSKLCKKNYSQFGLQYDKSTTFLECYLNDVKNPEREFVLESLWAYCIFSDDMTKMWDIGNNFFSNPFYKEMLKLFENV